MPEKSIIQREILINVVETVKNAGTGAVDGELLFELCSRSRKLVGNYRPLIIAAPGKAAQAIAKSLSETFGGAPVITDERLQCSNDEAQQRAVINWNEFKLEIKFPNRDSYRVRIYIPQE